ncbi:MAG: fimbrillin family protein, partial [Bacteroidales bacterium]|nr:fimbrillin family protein [Bacteroidales bacterium]
MLKSKSLYTLAVALLAAGVLLAGCAKEKGGQEPAARSAITIEAAIGTPTKVAYNGDAASFAAGDQISLYAWMGSAEAVPEKKIVDGVVNTFDGSVWTPETQMLWSHVKENHYFLGVYPKKYITNFTADAYTLGADLMIATELTGIPFKENAEPVKLTFTHALARLDVNLKFRNQWDELPTVTSVAATAKNQFAVNYLTKAVTASGTAAQVPVQALATAASGHDKSFSGVQVPQDGVTIVTVVIGGQSFIFTAAEPIALESGKITTLNLFVGKDKIELSSVSVAPWIENTPIAGGEALIPVTGISFKEGTSAAVEIDDTFQLTPVFAPEGATDVNCTWKSLNTSVATVDEMGLITAKARGEAVIECSCSGKSAQFTLTVNGFAPVYTAPTAKIGLVYNGTNLALLNAGSVTSEGPVMQYSLNQTDWSTTIPTGKNASSYDVYWRLQAGGNYEGVASTKIVASIAKKAPSLSVNPTSVSFGSTDNVDATKQVTITYDGDGALSASSNATGKVTASVNNKTITLTRKDVDGGSVTITVSAAAGTNYSAATNQQITVTLTSADPGTYL